MKEISLISVLGAGIFLGLLSNLGVRLIHRQAVRLGVIDLPNHRSSHTAPTPRGGGLAIVAFTLLTWIGFGSLYFSLPWLEIIGYALPALFIAGVSWVDDIKSLSNKIRFASHLISAICAIFAFGYFQSFGLSSGWQFNLGAWGIPLTIFWIVGLTNVYNFMDGIDGIAGTQAICAGLTWSMIGIFYEQPMIVLLAFSLTATNTGFLFHNWPPAQIFMGDVGSAFLGYSFAVLPLMLRHETKVNLLVLSILPLWLFIADATFTMLRRRWNSENIFTSHRSHLYQRLNIAGQSHRNITVLYSCLTGLGCLTTILFVYHSVSTIDWLVGLVFFLLVFILLYQLVLYIERKNKLV